MLRALDVLSGDKDEGLNGVKVRLTPDVTRPFRRAEHQRKIHPTSATRIDTKHSQSYVSTIFYEES